VFLGIFSILSREGVCAIPGPIYLAAFLDTHWGYPLIQTRRAGLLLLTSPRAILFTFAVSLPNFGVPQGTQPEKTT
jgi:hypothetical protein